MNLLDDMADTGSSLYQQASEGITSLVDQASDFIGISQPPQPIFRITLDGKDITDKIRKPFMSLTITDNRGFEADQLDLVLNDCDGMLDIPPRGVKINAQIGWKRTGLVDKGTYTVDEVEHDGAPDVLTIRARATDLREGMSTKREKSWHKTTIGQIVQAIAKQNGLKPAVSAWLAKQPVEHLDQTNESDANLLTRLAREHDAVATVKSGRLLFIKAGDAESVTGKKFPEVTIRRSSGDRHRFAVADRNAYTAVKATWHDVQKAKRGEIIVDANTKFERRAGVTKLGKKSKRTKLTAIQQRGIEPSSSNVKTMRHIYTSEATAVQGAKAAWQKLQRGVAEFSITLAEGRPELFPELPAKVQGFKPVIDSTSWVISKATHTLTDCGLITAIELEMKLEELDG